MSSEVIPRQSGAMKLWYLFIALVVMSFDQFTKYWVSVNLREGDEIDGPGARRGYSSRHKKLVRLRRKLQPGPGLPARALRRWNAKYCRTT